MKTAVICLGFFLVSGILARREVEIDGYNCTFHDDFLESVKATPRSSKSLNLSHQKITNIMTNAFGNLELETLILENNDLYMLDPFVFRALCNLEYLSLRNNNLITLLSVFGGLKNLKKLVLQNGTKLERGSLYGLTSSVEMPGFPKISGNIPSEYLENPFDFFASICIVDNVVKSLDVYDEDKDRQNAFKCVTKVLPVLDNSVDITGLKIEGFGKGWYRLHKMNVTNLDLRFNNIREITPEVLNDLPEGLTSVDLRYNLIKSVPNGVIKNHNLVALNLVGNDIEEIGDKAFANIKGKVGLEQYIVKNA